MSTSGARLVANQPLGEVGDEIAVAMVVPIDSLEELIRVPAIIRNVQEIEVSSDEVHERIQFQHGFRVHP